MSYLEKNVITSNEKILLHPKKNPLFLVLKWISAILFCWLLLIPIFKAIKATVTYCTTDYVITDKRVIEKYGWISTRTNEMPLNKIENATVIYSFWGKIFNYANVIFQGANRNNVTFYYVKNAEQVKKQYNETLNQL